MADAPAPPPPSSPPPATQKFRVRVMLITLGAVVLIVGTYLFGPIWPGALGRLQIATREGWGWAGPALIEIEVQPRAASIRLDGESLPGGIQGHGVMRAQLSAGVYHCTVRLAGYKEQRLVIDCVPDEQVRLRIVLEPIR